MALALLGAGHTVHLLANKWVEFAGSYHTFGHWLDIEQLHHLIKLHAPTTDVFHVHNEPSWMVTLVREECDVPVVLDVHDSFAARTTAAEAAEAMAEGTELVRITAEERNNFQLADALVFPGRRFADLVRDEYQLTQPHLVLPSYVPRHLYRYNLQDWLGGLVYEGKIQLNAEGRLSRGFRYCQYLALATECRRLGVDLHLYSRDDQPYLDAYGPVAIPHPPVPYRDLMKSIGRHDWGLVGNLEPTPEWDVAAPNKLWEYLAAGVPVAVINAAECAEIVRRENVGIVVDSIEELAWRWKEHRRCRATVIRQRAGYAMERNIEPLTALYERVCACGRG